jgi:hypothetical protein
MTTEFAYLVDVRDPDHSISSGQIIVQADCDENARRAVIGCMMEAGRNVLRICRIESPSSSSENEGWEEDSPFNS